jgi:hypothetical protein
MIAQDQFRRIAHLGDASASPPITSIGAAQQLGTPTISECRQRRWQRREPTALRNSWRAYVRSGSFSTEAKAPGKRVDVGCWLIAAVRSTDAGSSVSAPTGLMHRSKRSARLYGYSSTLSAPADSPSGTSRPSVLAVLRLMTKSIFVTCCTGRSAGFSPLRIRPV